MTGVSQVKKDTEKAMRLNTVEGGFAVSAENLAAPYLALFALALGASPSQIGMLTAFPNFLGNILQIPAALLAERMPDKRILPIIGGYFSRSTWIALAFLPFLFPSEQRVAVVIILASFRIIMANLGVPAWTSLQANLVPASIRGKYYANRNVVLNICALAATILATFLLRLSFPNNYRILFSLATGLGLMATFYFSRIPFDQVLTERGQSDKSKPLSEKFKLFFQEVKGYTNFVNYALSSLIWNFGVTLAASLFAVHFVDNLGGKAGSWAIFSGVNIATQILVQKYWGRLADLYGQKNVMTYAGIGAVLIPFLWFIAPNPWFPIVIYAINGIAWGGYNLAAFNLLLEVTPDQNRTVYVGVYNTLMGFATAAGPLLGGFAAEKFGLKAIFLLSVFFRGLGLLVFKRNVINISGQKMNISDLIPKRRIRSSF